MSQKVFLVPVMPELFLLKSLRTIQQFHGIVEWCLSLRI